MGLKGKQLPRLQVKAAAVRTVQYLYAADLQRLGIDAGEVSLAKHQDIVDAMLIGRFAILKVQGAIDTRQALEAVFDAPSRQNRNTWRVRSCSI
jgi:hypothetical protein